jgi:hypothetical protein
MLTENIEIGFCLDRYRFYQELPLHIIDDLPFCAYIVDYHWTYLFINKASENIFGEEVQNLLGKNALEVFKHDRFKSIFEKIRSAVDQKTICDAIIYSPLRGRQVKIKGYPLEDCYYFASVVLPSKEELMDELREELNRRKETFS